MEAESPYIPRCGDTVRHRPTGETWEVAFAEGNDLAWFGWPDGRARLSDCEIVERCSDEEHQKRVSVWLDNPPHDDRGNEDSRVHAIRRLYRPHEARRMHLGRMQRDAGRLAHDVEQIDTELFDLLVSFGGAPIQPCASCGTPLVNRRDGERGIHDCACGWVVCVACAESQEHHVGGRHGLTRGGA